MHSFLLAMEVRYIIQKSAFSSRVATVRNSAELLGTVLYGRDNLERETAFDRLVD